MHMDREEGVWVFPTLLAAVRKKGSTPSRFSANDSKGSPFSIRNIQEGWLVGRIQFQELGSDLLLRLLPLVGNNNLSN